MAEDFDLCYTKLFEVDLGSSLRHCCRASSKLKQLTLNSVELKLSTQTNITCKGNNIDLSIKNIIDDIQNIRGKLNTIESTVDPSDKVVFNFEKTVEDFENIAKIISNNKNTIFSHRDLL